MRRVVALVMVVSWCLCSPFHFARAQDDAKVKKLITQLLQDKDVKKRRLALFDLEIEGPKARGVLQALGIALEKDPEPIVRREAGLTLARFADRFPEDAQAAIPSLASALTTDKDDAVREVAARALLQMVPHSKRALHQLGLALNDSQASVRAAAALTIKTLGEDAKPAVPQLIDYLKSPKDKHTDAAARINVAQALGRVGEEGAMGSDVLITVLSDGAEDTQTREAAADSLGRLGDGAKGAAKPLAAILGNDKNEQSLRIAAVKSLANVEGDIKDIGPALKTGMADSDSTIRILTVHAAARYGKEDPEVIKLAIKVARNDDNVEVRLAAVQELGLLGAAAKSAEPDLRYIMEHDERESVRDQAEIALKRISGAR